MSAKSTKLLVGSVVSCRPNTVEEVDFDHKLNCSYSPLVFAKQKKLTSPFCSFILKLAVVAPKHNLSSL